MGLRGGMVRVGTGSRPAVSDLRHSASPQTGHPDKASRSAADKGGERLPQHERGKADCHDDRRGMSKPGQGQECRVQDQDVHQGKPAPVPQASSSDHKRKVSGTSDGNTSVKPTQHQHANAIAASAAQARDKLNTASKKSQNGNKHEPNPQHVGIPHDDKSPRQRGASSTDNNEVDKEKRKVDKPSGDACYEDIPGSKKMRGECDAETVVDRAQGKRN